ncbi:competence type IV pilus minor pilin ComGE [Enterococcus viikkiensis]|uniref:Competence type IV pilus minor pilin ComGE n=1 Tax=Enterococcus viikkiensis TaxID=930854 RepID=A0ABU3FSW3_9ENTE|nr:competence type IV pilus minor pilin ComGE [Enterococcus viikkiensis]MDT2827977.1 competence type IV pilus minor pilin ComGE [Enterococcus viikkiensis]
MKENEGYILLESLISLVILIILVTSYLDVTTEMRQESQERLASLVNYRDLYNETRRYRLHATKPSKGQINISFEEGRAFNQQGGILIVKK